MSELRERMSNAMCLRGMAARTQEAYIGALVELAKYYHRSLLVAAKNRGNLARKDGGEWLTVEVDKKGAD